MARCTFSGRTSGQDTCGRNNDRGLRAGTASASSLDYTQAAYLRYDPLRTLSHIENPEYKASGYGRHHVSCGGS